MQNATLITAEGGMTLTIDKDSIWKWKRLP